MDSRLATCQTLCQGWEQGPRGPGDGRNYREGDFSLQTSSATTSSWQPMGGLGLAQGLLWPLAPVLPHQSR